MRALDHLPFDFLDYLPFGVIICDREERLHQVNSWIRQRLSLSLEATTHLNEITYSQTYPVLHRALERVFTERLPTFLSSRLHHSIFRLSPSIADPSLETVPQKIHLFPVEGEEETFVAILVEDISDRVVTENHLRRELVRFQTLYQIVSQLNALEEEAFRKSLEHLHRFLNADHSLLYLIEDHAFRLHTYIGLWAPKEALPEKPPEHSLIAWALQERRAWLWNSLIKHPLQNELHLLDPQSRSAIVAPLSLGGTIMGAVSVESRAQNAFDYDDLTLLTTIADRMALSVQLMSSLERERRLRRLAEALRETGLRLTTELDSNRVQDLILEFVQQVVPYDSAAVLMVDEENCIYVSRHRGYERFGVDPVTMSSLRFKMEDLPNLKKMALTLQPLVIPNTAADPQWVKLPTSEHIKSWVGAPIVAQAKLLGFLALDHTQPGFYNAEHAQVLALFAAETALALENARQYEEQYHQAITDALTGLANRRHLQNALSREVPRALRFGRPLSLLILDLDDFKRYNDTFGHPAGDKVLQAVARILLQATRKMDLVARYGGEEFVVLLPETSTEPARQVAERIRQQVAKLHTMAAYEVRTPLTISIGVATLPDHAQTQTDLLLAADVALYQAKQKGKNRVEVFRPGE